MEFRQNVATREWVLFSPERGRRPEDFRIPAPSWTHGGDAWRQDCPFCPGDETRTAGETLRYVDDAGQWTVRAFPNAFPAVLPNGTEQRRGDAFHNVMDACGVHEVIAESPLHNTTLARQDESTVRLVTKAWRERVTTLRARTEAEHVILFKNHGVVAGSSLAHPHSQVVSLPVTPWQIRHRQEEAMRYFDDQGECVICAMLRVECADAARIVAQGPHFVGFIPYAAFSPFSIWLAPRRHHGCLSRTNDEEIDELAHHLRVLLAKIYVGLHDPPYNLVVRSASRDHLDARFFHCYVAIVPRLQKSAGFEMGTGMFINTTLPENDAAYLRSVDID